MNRNYLSPSKIQYLILLLFLFVCPVHSQTSENYAETIPDYVYGLGKGVGRALASDCSAALTLIEDVKVNQSAIYDEIDVKLSVIKYYRFPDDRKKGDPEINLSYQKPRKPKFKPTSNPYDWYLLVNIVKGNKAMIFKSKSGMGPFVTTDVAYFDKIKQAIDLTERFRADYLNALDYFANDFESDDELIKGAALNFLFPGPGIPGDVKAYILVNLLSESPASMQREGWSIKGGIGHLEANYTADAPAEFRRQAFTKLVQIAGGEDEKAVDATVILADIADGNSDELRPYLKSGKRGNIMKNLQKFMINVKGDGFTPEPLMKLLSEN